MRQLSLQVAQADIGLSPRRQVVDEAGEDALAVDPGFADRQLDGEGVAVAMPGCPSVRISAVAVSHGSLTITIASTQGVSQPAPLSNGKTAIVQGTETEANEQKGAFKVVEELPTIQEVASALNALGLSTRDMMAIFQAMKTAGALQADLVLE